MPYYVRKNIASYIAHVVTHMTTNGRKHKLEYFTELRMNGAGIWQGS